MNIQLPGGIVRLSCGGKPLKEAYLPPESNLAELGRYLARKYATTDDPKGDKTA